MNSILHFFQSYLLDFSSLAASGKRLFQISSPLHEEILAHFLQGLTFRELFHLCHLLPTFDIALNSFILSHALSLELYFTVVTFECPLFQQIQVMFLQCFCVKCQAAESILYCRSSFLTAASSGPSYCLFRVWEWGRGRTQGNYFYLAEAFVLEKPWCSWMSPEMQGCC